MEFIAFLQGVDFVVHEAVRSLPQSADEVDQEGTQ
jgi:hypothetical protein